MAVEVGQRNSPSEHDRETVDGALIALIMANGNCSRAAENAGVDRSTISRWRDKYADRYLELRQTVEPKIAQTLAAEHEDAALLALSKAKDMLELIDPDTIEAKERGKLTQQLAVAGGIFTDKASALRGRPTEVVDHRHAVEIVHKLKTTNPSLIVDGTAVEEAAADELTPA